MYGYLYKSHKRADHPNPRVCTVDGLHAPPCTEMLLVISNYRGCGF